MGQRYDMVAIGGGAAGLVSAAGAAGLGARAALVERDRMGGECLWTGCVPSKALIAAARAAADARAAARFGVNAAGVEIDFARVMRHVHAAQERIAPHDSPERFRSLGVEVFAGTARFLDARTVDVDGRRLHARHFVLATGSRPAVPPVEGLADVPFLTNENVFTLTALPARLLVLGAGAVGLELAQAFARLGSEVTVVEQESALLPREDHELAGLLAGRLADEGVALRLGTRAVRCAHHDDTFTLTVTRGTSEPASPDALQGDALLVATGRRPNLAFVEPDAAGIAYDAEGVRVDDRLRTNVRGIWAAGDVVAGAPRFTHVADYHARTVLRNALFPGSTRVDYRVVPWVTYSDPPFARVGLTESEARARFGDRVQVARRDFGGLDRAIADGAPFGMLKLVADRRGRLLGAHVLGAGADGVIASAALAMKHGITLRRVSATIHAYPTYAETFRHGADAWVRASFGGVAARVVRWIVRKS